MTVVTIMTVEIPPTNGNATKNSETKSWLLSNKAVLAPNTPVQYKNCSHIMHQSSAKARKITHMMSSKFAL